jgi:Protein of unknown function (DUF2997)
VSRKIHVRITPAGEITVEAEGYKGNGCEAATKAIEKALGKPSNRTRKHEYWWNDNSRNNQQKLGGGET